MPTKQWKGVKYMSESEKDIIRKIASTVPRLSRDKQNYILGVAEGMAIAKEDFADRIQNRDQKED